MKNLNIWMIVQSNNFKHINNFNCINQKTPIHYFPAIQSSEHYQIFSDFSVHKNYFHKHFVKQLESDPDALGENLSHLLLFNNILEKSEHDWNLIIDGSILMDVAKFTEQYENILQITKETNCEFIQLYMPSKFFTTNNVQKFSELNIYELSIQVSTKVYLIHKNAINKFINELPLKQSVLEHFGAMISSWKSLYWKNDCFQIM